MAKPPKQTFWRALLRQLGMVVAGVLLGWLLKLLINPLLPKLPPEMSANIRHFSGFAFVVLMTAIFVYGLFKKPNLTAAERAQTPK